MGYHLIIKNHDGTITPKFSDTFDGLAEYSDISADSIIYQGEQHWSPVLVGQHDQYKNLTDERFRAGIKAQKLFKSHAVDHGLMIEELSQDMDSFKAYTSNADVSIKRGDFLIRNVRNIEIETKCFTFYSDSFYIPFTDVKRHQNMQNYAGSPVILAIYERNGDVPVPESLRMITIQTIIEENYKSVKFDEKSKCLIIPLALTKHGFYLIDEVRKAIEKENGYPTIRADKAVTR